MLKILIVANEGESVIIAGMPEECTINKRYRCRMCPKCRCNLQSGQCTSVEKYYNAGELTND